MEKTSIKEIFERKGIDESLVDVPVIYSVLNLYSNDRNTNFDVLVTKLSRNKVKIGTSIFTIRDDGTIRVDKEGYKDYSVTDKMGVEVENVIEVTNEGEHKKVRRDGTIREVLVTDQGEEYIGKSVYLDNGDFTLRYTAVKVRDEKGEPIYFNAEDALRKFDDNMYYLRTGTIKQRIYYREARRRLEEAIQDEKISRLPLAERVKALRDIKDDLEVEYVSLCDLIEIDLADHRNNLYLVEKVMKSKKAREQFEEELDDYKNVIGRHRISANSSGETLPRVLPYLYSDDGKGSEESRFQKEEEALIEKIYEYRMRNAELRDRKDKVTEMVGAINPLYNKVADPNYKKGLILSLALRRYEKDRDEIDGERTKKKDLIKARTQRIAKLRKDKKDKERFERERQKQREARKVVDTVKPETPVKDDKKVVRGVDDEDDSRGSRSIYTPAGKA